MNPLTFSAVLLAAGRSTRMGGDKALLPVMGQPLWQRQWALLEQSGVLERMPSVRPHQTWVPADSPTVVDEVVDAGPLAGIAASMARATTTHLMVLAVDLPRMETKWFAELTLLCSPGVGAVGRREGFYEPLAAIYPCTLLGAAETALAKGERSLQRFIAKAGSAMEAREIAEPESGWFDNWNEPSDVAGG